MSPKKLGKDNNDDRDKQNVQLCYYEVWGGCLVRVHFSASQIEVKLTTKRVQYKSDTKYKLAHRKTCNLSQTLQG